MNINGYVPFRKNTLENIVRGGEIDAVVNFFTPVASIIFC